MNAATQQSSTMGARLNRGLLCAVDVAIACIVFAVPLFMGGWHPAGRLCYVTCVVTALSAWCIRQAIYAKHPWRFSGIELVLVAGAGLLALQAAALPADLAQKLSPLTAELLPLWSGNESASGLPPWSHVSLMPAATRDALVMWLAHMGLFLLVIQRIQAVDDVERLFRWAAIAISAMAVIGLAQFLVGNGKFLWVYDYPYRDTTGAVKGTFANENHFAHYMALGIGPLLWWIGSLSNSIAGTSRHRNTHKRKQRTWQGMAHDKALLARQEHIRFALFVALGIVAFAGLLTFSRGGVIVLLLAAITSVTLFTAQGAFGRKALLGLGAAAVVVIAAIIIHGFAPLADEMATLSGGGTQQQAYADGARLRLWAADMQALARTPLLGTGAGTHAEVYPTFFSHQTQVEYTQAESGYVQVLLETGIAGALILLFLWIFTAQWTLGTLRGAGDVRLQLAAVAISSGLLVSLVHSVWDFVWFFPGCMSLVVIYAACACRLWQMQRLVRQEREEAREERETAPPVSRFSWAIASVACIGIGVIMIADRIGPVQAAGAWERFVALQKMEQELGEDASTDALVAPLANVLQHTPEHARAQVRMAAVCLRKFEELQQSGEVPMPLSQIRDAAIASQFPSRAAQDEWLDRVVGENRKWLDAALQHTQAGLRLCPLQGEAYTLLAELSFLEGPRALPQNLLMQQALRVRPYESHVLFAAGREAALAGENERALNYWRTAFHRDAKYRRFIIAAAAPGMSADEMLKHFEPDLEETQDIYDFYRYSGLNEDAAVIARRLAGHLQQDAASDKGRSAARKWHKAHGMYAFLTEHERALACIREAVAAAPMEYDYHRDLAAALLNAGEFEEAVQEVRWCRQRRRDDPKLERLWEVAKRGPISVEQR